MALKSSDKLEITEEILELLESKRKVYLRALRQLIDKTYVTSARERFAFERIKVKEKEKKE
ncbi:hypothetical protein WH47_07056 [Habropoda laboriosa]|uniref:Uncharacterized protein n=1 Tax=Habropoda laboriosa TaxID=597456 RepID=A0A0L7RGN0_9HYME|nr:hypothetical protein WH47_07056 [Habropoda laboriosa]